MKAVHASTFGAPPPSQSDQTGQHAPAGADHSSASAMSASSSSWVGAHHLVESVRKHHVAAVGRDDGGGDGGRGGDSGSGSSMSDKLKSTLSSSAATGEKVKRWGSQLLSEWH